MFLSSTRLVKAADLNIKIASRTPADRWICARLPSINIGEQFDIQVSERRQYSNSDIAEL
jgi:hypothetical protein